MDAAASFLSTKLSNAIFGRMNGERLSQNKCKGRSRKAAS